MTSQAILAARLSRITEQLVTDATKGEKPVSRRKHRQLKRRFNAALAEMTLESYVDWCNRGDDVFALAPAVFWRERGITTALDLARVLDAEHRRNVEKSERYDYGDED